MVHPLKKNVEFTQGLEDMANHQSAGGKNPHTHCSKCGCFLTTDLTYMMSNVFKDESRMCINVSSLSLNRSFFPIR